MVKTIEHRKTFADLLELLGGVPLHRILTHPAPGTATEDDVEELMESPDKRLYELVHGVLLEKDTATREARIGGIVYQHLQNYLDDNDIGIAIPSN